MSCWPSMELACWSCLKLPGMGPKTVALLWSAAQVGSIDQLAEAIEAGRLAGLAAHGREAD